jgi:N-acetyl sugar amidotransferase
MWILHFDVHGYCNHCNNYFSNIRHRMYGGAHSEAVREFVLSKIKRAGKGKKYDCVIGVSGGVDSSYVAWLAKNEGLRPLLVHLDNGWNSEISVENIRKLAHLLDLDYECYVLDWEEFRRIQLSFLRASVPEMETPTDMAIPGALHKVAAKYGVKYIISGGNFATEGILPKTWHYNAKDTKYFRHILKKFGNVKASKFPVFGAMHETYYKLIKGIKIIYLLNYFPFNKDEAQAFLESKLGWKYYGGKHYESVYTGFVQSYIMPVKFNMDYRRATLSTQICAGEVERMKAIEILKEPSFSDDKAQAEKEYICKKLHISVDEFELIMEESPLIYRDYPNGEKRLQFIYRVYRKLYKKSDYKGGN